MGVPSDEADVKDCLIGPQSYLINVNVIQEYTSKIDCKRACTDDCFSILDRASTKFQLRIKEGLYIKWEQPVLNKQLYSYTSTLIL